MPDQNYVEPELPGLPEHGPQAGSRLVLDLYANEIAAHAAGMTAIAGLSPIAADRYKQFCFEAVKQLRSAANLLRDNGYGQAPPAAPQRDGTGLLSRLFGGGGGPQLAMLFLAGAGFFALAISII